MHGACGADGHHGRRLGELFLRGAHRVLNGHRLEAALLDARDRLPAHPVHADVELARRGLHVDAHRVEQLVGLPDECSLGVELGRERSLRRVFVDQVGEVDLVGAPAMDTAEDVSSASESEFIFPLYFL